MTKAQLVELVISNLSGGASSSDLMSKYHPLVIEKYMDLVYQNVVNQVAINSIIFRDWGQLDQYCKTVKNVACTKDTDRNEWYSDIPLKVVEVQKNRGIRLISPMKDQKNKFWYTENATEDVWGELEARSVEDFTSFYREGNRVYYSNFKDDYATVGLLFKLTCPLSEFDEDDEIGVPGAKAYEFITLVRELVLKSPQEKNTEDNTSKQIQ
jgi:hypothetical protein